MNPLLHFPRFAFSDAALAVDRPVATVRNWAARGGFHLDPDMDKGAAAGGVRMLSLASVYRLAIAVELIDYGMAPNRAFMAAARFADVSDYEAQDIGDKSEPKGRAPGELYPEGFTLLLVGKKEGLEFFGPSGTNVVNVADKEQAHSIFLSNFVRGNAAILAVNCNTVVQSVNQRLGLK